MFVKNICVLSNIYEGTALLFIELAKVWNICEYYLSTPKMNWVFVETAFYQTYHIGCFKAHIILHTQLNIKIRKHTFLLNFTSS